MTDPQLPVFFPPAITSLYFIESVYITRTIDGQEYQAITVGSRSEGLSITGATDRSPQWTRPGGFSPHNIGSVLSVPDLPYTVDLTFACVAYGCGEYIIEFSFAAEAEKIPLIAQRKTRVLLSPLNGVTGSLGLASITQALPHVQLPHTGLYWLTAYVGDGPIARLPLYVHEHGKA